MLQQAYLPDNDALQKLSDSYYQSVLLELAEIMKFQHGYNAAAKFVTVWDSMIDTVINRLGV